MVQIAVHRPKPCQVSVGWVRCHDLGSQSRERKSGVRGAFDSAIVTGTLGRMCGTVHVGQVPQSRECGE